MAESQPKSATKGSATTSGATAPDVSFLMAARDAERTIEAAIASALDQAGVTVEVVVVDDGSRDKTADRARRAGPAHQVTVLQGPARGPASARNIAIEAARGRWLAVLDADDVIEPVRSRDLIAAATAHGADIVADNLVRFRDDDPSVLQPLLPIDPPAHFEIGLIDWIERNHMLGGPTNLGYLKPMFRADLIQRHGLRYDSQVVIGEDYLLVLAALGAGGRLLVTTAPTYRYRVQAGSLSRRFDSRTAVQLQLAQQRIMAQVSDSGHPGLSRAVARHARGIAAAIAWEEAKDLARRGQWRSAMAYSISRPSFWNAVQVLARRRLLRG